MVRRPIALLFACGLTSLAMLVAASLPIELSAASKTATKAAKKPIRNPKFDPTAEQVDLFEAMDAKQVSVKLIPKDAMGGTVLMENLTDKPLTIKVPDAVAGVSIHAQMGGMGGMGGGGMGGGGMGGGGGGQQMGGGMGGGQMGGGGGQMGGGGMGGMGGGGGGFFSIPAEKVVSVQFNSVCLEHGKPEPSSNSKYTLVPLSRVNSNPVLYQLLTKVGTGKVDPQSAQAAAWHLTDKMSFEELAAKTEEHLGDVNPSPYFSREQLLGAQQLLAQAESRADEDTTEEPSEKNVEPKTSRVRTARATTK